MLSAVDTKECDLKCDAADGDYGVYVDVGTAKGFWVPARFLRICSFYNSSNVMQDF